MSPRGGGGRQESNLELNCPAVIEEMDDGGKTTTGGSSEEEVPSSFVLGRSISNPKLESVGVPVRGDLREVGGGAPFTGTSAWQGWDGKVDSVEMQDRRNRQGSIDSEPRRGSVDPVTPTRSRKSSSRQTGRPISMVPLNDRDNGTVTPTGTGIGAYSLDRRMSSPSSYTPSGPTTRPLSSSGSPRPPNSGHRPWSSQGNNSTPTVGVSTPLDGRVGGSSQYADGGDGEGGSELVRRPSGSIRRKPVPMLLGKSVGGGTTLAGGEVPPLPEGRGERKKGED